MVKKEDNLSKKEREEVKKEISKALHRRLLEKTSVFGSKFKEQTSAAIITAFGLVIALAWKDVVVEAVGRINQTNNLLFSAIIVTVISILGIALISRWSKKSEKVP